MDFAKLDFQQLRVRHISFKSKVRLVLFGGNFDNTFLLEGNPVSEWFSTVGREKYRHEPEIKKLQTLHLDLSGLAHRLIALYQQNKIDQAHLGLAELNEKSEDFLVLLDQLQLRVSSI